MMNPALMGMMPMGGFNPMMMQGMMGGMGRM